MRRPGVIATIALALSTTVTVVATAATPTVESRILASTKVNSLPSGLTPSLADIHNKGYFNFTGGTLLNMKFTPSLLEGDAGIDHLHSLVRSYFKLDGHHMQFNVVSADTLRAAKANPAEYRDLIVRVAGYSDYFCDLSEALQDEIIRRTEHTEF